METVEEYLQNRDSDVLLVSLSERIQSGKLEDTANVLLQGRYKDVLQQLGWDLLGLFVPHLREEHDRGWQLVCKIAEVCSPKEMSIAFLEQMELLDDAGVVFKMLQPLCRVLVQLKQESILCSSLHSVHRLIQHHYHTLQEPPEKATVLESGSPPNSEALVPPHNEACSEHATQAETSVKEEEEEEESEGHDEHTTAAKEGEVCRDLSQTSLSVHTAVRHVLEFTRPITARIQRRNLATLWTPVQRECLVLLMSLLDEPLVRLNLQKPKRDVKSNPHRATAEAIMAEIAQCRGGCVQLLQYQPLPPPAAARKRRLKREAADLEDEEASSEYKDSCCSLSALGLGCFAYLLQVEGMEDAWFPSILSPAFLLQVNLDHATCLIERTETSFVTKGLSLLNAVLLRVPDRSIASHVLDDRRYLQVAELLAEVMVYCPENKLRQLGLKLFNGFLKVFDSRGCYRLQRSLLESVGHAGVVGLVVGSVKDELDSAFKVCDAASPYFGGGLVPVLKKVMCVSHDSNVLEDTNRLMPALNLLRYLFIRDRENQTGVWQCVEWLQSQFTGPLRTALLTGRAAYCQQEGGEREGGGNHSSSSRGRGEGVRTAEVEVKVLGGGGGGGSLEPPQQLTPQEQRKMSSLALHQLDMLESVLVRVEELMQQQQPSSS